MPTKPYTSYDAVISACQAIFEKKIEDYGTAWRILRLSSITDQIMIKAQRIRTIQEKGMQQVPEAIDAELIGIINYSIIALIQLQLPIGAPLNFTYQELAPLYEEIVRAIKVLQHSKNHDYGEAWRAMRLSSLIDIILMKLFRIQRIEDNQGNTLISEGIVPNYQDIINYAVFSLMKL